MNESEPLLDKSRSWRNLTIVFIDSYSLAAE